MKIYIATLVKQKPEIVINQFNKELFMALAPPGIKVELTRFDGCIKNDEVHLVLDFIFFKQKWNSLIIDNGKDEKGIFFVDQGIKLPFFLKRWKHIHRVDYSQDGSKIVDDITFSTGLILTDLLMYPILYLQFLYRKPIFRKKFDV